MFKVSLRCHPLLTAHNLYEALGLLIVHNPWYDLVGRTSVADDHDVPVPKLHILPFRRVKYGAGEAAQNGQVVQALRNVEDAERGNSVTCSAFILAAIYEIQE